MRTHGGDKRPRPVHDSFRDYFEYSIVSWFGRDKAVAWAALVHKGKSPESKIFRVWVDDLGEPTLDPDGYRLEPDEYTDRMEW